MVLHPTAHWSRFQDPGGRACDGTHDLERQQSHTVAHAHTTFLTCGLHLPFLLLKTMWHCVCISCPCRLVSGTCKTVNEGFLSSDPGQLHHLGRLSWIPQLRASWTFHGWEHRNCHRCHCCCLELELLLELRPSEALVVLAEDDS